MKREDLDEQYAHYCDMQRESNNPEDLMIAAENDEIDHEDYDMAKKEEVTQPEVEQPSIRFALESLLARVSQYPLNNVLQRFMQSMVTEVARARFLADRIQLGDEALFDISKPERPGPDQDNTPGVPNQRTLSERQYELLLQCQEDEAELVGAIVEVKAFYTHMFGMDKPVYAIAEDGKGGWTQITDFNQALDSEYRKAHQQWLKRQNEAKSDISPEAMAIMMDDAKRRAAKLMDQL